MILNMHLTDEDKIKATRALDDFCNAIDSLESSFGPELDSECVDEVSIHSWISVLEFIIDAGNKSMKTLKDIRKSRLQNNG